MLRSIQLADESVAELSMHCSLDDDVLQQMTATSNRIRGLLTQIHPALERVVGPYPDHPAMLDLLQHYPSPAAMKSAGTTRMAARLLKLAQRMGRRLAEEITQALSEQTVVVVGTNAAATVLPRTEVAGKRFESSGHLAAYAGLAPVTRRSGSSIRGEYPSRRGNKILERAMFLCAFAALRDPVSRTYYDRKIAQGKRHIQALIALARRRCDVVFAMLRDGTLYEADHALAA